MRVCASCEAVDVVGYVGANATLQSSLRIHALNSVEVKWFKIVGNSHRLATGISNPKDYSLTIPDLSHEDAGKYFASATSKEHAEWKENGPVITLSVQGEL